MNVLQISSLKINEVDSSLFNAVYSILNSAKLEISIPPVTIWDETQNLDDYDVIVIGIHDLGVTISSDLYLKLIEFRDKGGGILFTHGCPRIWDAASSLSNLDPQMDLNRLTWISQFSNFGISNFQTDFTYIFFSSVFLEKDHPIFTTPFKIPLELNIQETHNTGLILSKDCQVLISNPSSAPDFTNFYLAVFEEENKGKIAYCSLGHNNFSSSSFFDFGVDECQLFVNILNWLSPSDNNVVASLTKTW